MYFYKNRPAIERISNHSSTKVLRENLYMSVVRIRDSDVKVDSITSPCARTNETLDCSQLQEYIL